MATTKLCTWRWRRRDGYCRMDVLLFYYTRLYDFFKNQQDLLLYWNSKWSSTPSLDSNIPSYFQLGITSFKLIWHSSTALVPPSRVKIPSRYNFPCWNDGVSTYRDQGTLWLCQACQVKCSSNFNVGRKSGGKQVERDLNLTSSKLSDFFGISYYHLFGMQFQVSVGWDSGPYIYSQY